MKRLIVAALAVALLPLFVHAQTAAPILNFSANTTTGQGQVTPTLTWSTTPAATSCTASGASNWTGTKPASGSATLATIVASATYVMSCTWPGDTTATLTWTMPTLNTDGTALTNLAGVNTYYSLGTDLNAATGVLTKQFPGASTTTGQITGLTPGTYTFGIKAYTTTGVQSALSNTATKTIVATQNVTRTVAITVNPNPNPPTNLVVE